MKKVHDYIIRVIDTNVYQFNKDKLMIKNTDINYMWTDYIMENCVNSQDIQHNINDINTMSILVHNGKMYIFQYGGYNWDIGLFTQLIDLEKWNITR